MYAAPFALGGVDEALRWAPMSYYSTPSSPYADFFRTRKVTTALSVLIIACYFVLKPSWAGFSAYALDSGHWWVLVTNFVTHFSLDHLLFNVMMIVLVGGEIERVFGPGAMLLTFFLGGFGGTLAVWAFDPYSLTAGASSAGYAVMGVLLVMSRDKRGPAVLLGINILYSFFPGVSMWGHIGGLVGGFVAAGIIKAMFRRQQAGSRGAPWSMG